MTYVETVLCTGAVNLSGKSRKIKKKIKHGETDEFDGICLRWERGESFGTLNERDQEAGTLPRIPLPWGWGTGIKPFLNRGKKLTIRAPHPKKAPGVGERLGN